MRPEKNCGSLCSLWGQESLKKVPSVSISNHQFWRVRSFAFLGVRTYKWYTIMETTRNQSVYWNGINVFLFGNTLERLAFRSRTDVFVRRLLDSSEEQRFPGFSMVPSNLDHFICWKVTGLANPWYLYTHVCKVTTMARLFRGLKWSSSIWAAKNEPPNAEHMFLVHFSLTIFDKTWAFSFVVSSRLETVVLVYFQNLPWYWKITGYTTL